MYIVFLVLFFKIKNPLLHIVLVYNEWKFYKVIYAKDTPPIIYKLEYHACSQTSLSPSAKFCIKFLTSCYFISNLN